MDDLSEPYNFVHRYYILDKAQDPLDVAGTLSVLFDSSLKIILRYLPVIGFILDDNLKRFRYLPIGGLGTQAQSPLNLKQSALMSLMCGYTVGSEGWLI